MALVGVALFGFGVNLLILLIEGLKVGLEIVKGVVAFAWLGESFESKILREFNFKSGVRIGALGAHSEVEEPFDWGEGFTFKGFNFLTTRKDEEGIAGDGIKRFNTTAHLYGQFCKFAEVVAAVARLGA